MSTAVKPLDQAKLYLEQATAASFSNIIIFGGLMTKSYQQVNRTTSIPRISLAIILKEALKASPTIGTIVGIQMTLQKSLENFLTTYSSKKESRQKKHMNLAISSLIIGGGSALPLAIFNGQTMEHSIKASIKGFTGKQFLAIVSRECSFLYSLGASKSIGKEMKKNLVIIKKLKI